VATVAGRMLYLVGGGLPVGKSSLTFARSTAYPARPPGSYWRNRYSKLFPRELHFLG
jgi:hypothetical protein